MALSIGELYVSISAQLDELEKGVKKAQRDLKGFERDAKAAAQITADISKFERNMQRATKHLDDFATKAERVGRSLTVALTLPLAAAGAAAIKMASDAEETANKFDVSFGDMSNEVRAFAHEMASEMGRSKVQMEGFMAQLQSILKPLTGNAEAAAEMSKTLSVLAVDIGSFMNMADQDVLNRLQSGLLGSTEAVDQLGINLRESEMQLEAHRQGIQGDVSQLDEATKTYLRFGVILRQTTDAQGDAIRTAGSFANQLKALQADVSDLAVEIGQQLLPYAQQLVTWARDMTDAFSELSPESRKSLLELAGIAAIAGPLVLGLASVVKMISSTGKALSILTKFAKTNPYLLLGLAAAGLALQFEQVQDAIDRLFEKLGFGKPFEALDEFGRALDGVTEDSAAEAAKMGDLGALFKNSLANIAGAIKDGAAGVDTAGKDAADKAAKAAADLRKRLEKELNQTNRALAKLIDQQFPTNMDPMDPGEFLRAIGLPAGEDIQAIISERQDVLRAIQEFAAGLKGIEVDRRVAEITGIPLDEMDVLKRQLELHSNLFKALNGIIPETSALYVYLKDALAGVSTAYLDSAKAAKAAAEQKEADAEATKRSAEAADEANQAWMKAVLAFEKLELDQTLGLENLRKAQEFDVHMRIIMGQLPKGDVERLSEELAVMQQHVIDKAQAKLRVKQAEAAKIGEPFAIEVSQFDIDNKDKTALEAKFAEIQAALVKQLNEAWNISMGKKAPLEFVGNLFSNGSPEQTFALAIEEAMGTSELDVVRRRIQDTLNDLNVMQAAKIPINKSDVQERLKALKELREEAARLTLDMRLADINKELQQAIGPRIEIEQLLASVTGEEFDPAKAKMQAFQRAIWDTAAALLAQGKSMEEVNKQLQPLIDGYTEAAAAVKPPESALAKIKAELDKTLTDRLTIETMLASATGQEFDATQFQAQAIEGAINSIVSEMLRTGSGFEAIWTEIDPLVQQLRALRQATEKPFIDLKNVQERLEQELDPATNFLKGFFEGLAPAIAALTEPLQIIGRVISTILAPILTAFAPILRFVADVFIQVAIVIGQVWNALVSIIDAIPFVNMSGWYIDIDQLRQAQRDLYDETQQTTDAVREFGEQLRNVPQGFKVALERFSSAEGIPALADGGIVTRPTLAMIGEAGPEAVVPLGRSGGMGGERTEIHVSLTIQGSIYADDLERRVVEAVSKAVRQADLARYGTQTGGRR